MSQPSCKTIYCQWCIFISDVPPGSCPTNTSILSALSTLGSASETSPKNHLQVSGENAHNFSIKGCDRHVYDTTSSIPKKSTNL